jgi:phosphate/sulfate permease
MLNAAMVNLTIGTALAVIVGANNGAISLGANIGTHVIRRRGAILLSILGMTVGFLLEGHRMQNAIFGVIQSEGNYTTMLGAIVLSAVLALMILATRAGIPLSLSQVTVGGVVGAALVINLSIRMQTLVAYTVSWGLTPIVAAFLAALVRSCLRRAHKRASSILRSTQLYASLTIATSAYIAYILGANVLGVLAATIEAPSILKIASVLLGAVMGTVFLHGRIAQAAGDRLSTLMPASALAAQVSAAATLHVLTELGIPSSITQALIGAIVGTRLGVGVGVSNRRLLKETVIWWLIAPLGGLLLASALGKVFIA